MMKKIIPATLILILSGCSVTTQSPGVTQQQMQSALAQTQAQLSAALAAQCATPEQVEALQGKVQKLEQTLQQVDANKLNIVAAAEPATCQEVKPQQDKMILGALESVYINLLKMELIARIDTGAESSSLDARDIQEFERDGKKWVRFSILKDQQTTEHEAKVVRFVNIKQSGNTEPERRPVIQAHLQIGAYGQTTEVNLTNRAHLDYQLLLGRKFMKDIAIVDVAVTFAQGEPKQPTPKKKDN